MNYSVFSQALAWLKVEDAIVDLDVECLFYFVALQARVNAFLLSASFRVSSTQLKKSSSS